MHFVIFPMHDYLEFFNNYPDIAKGTFGNPSFRYENNKLNNLHIDDQNYSKADKKGNLVTSRLCWSYTNTRLSGKTILRKRRYALTWSKDESNKRKQIYS